MIKRTSKQYIEITKDDVDYASFAVVISKCVNCGADVLISMDMKPLTTCVCLIGEHCYETVNKAGECEYIRKTLKSKNNNCVDIEL